MPSLQFKGRVFRPDSSALLGMGSSGSASVLGGNAVTGHAAAGSDHVMRALLPYVLELERQMSTPCLSGPQWEAWCDRCLDGGPSRELRDIVSLADLKEQGAFFTGPELGRRAALAFGPQTADESVYFDPACGVGNLLLAAAGRLPLAPTAAETLALWGNRLAGCDLVPVFVRAAKARLALLAMRRRGHREQIAPEAVHELLPAITVGDAMRCPERYAAADRIVMNPPFRAIGAPAGCAWSAGRTNSAALFVESALLNARAGTRVAAILPDVLRSGSRYRRWRRMVGENALVDEIVPCGLFDRHADVDVFLLRLTVDNGRNVRTDVEWACVDSDRGATVASYFKVRVGTVVPHRHGETGPKHPYVHARSLPPWEAVSKIPETRRFTGTVFRPPFVAIRRTSGPRDRSRAVATIVRGRRAVAVENHVIVCLPEDGSIERCRALLARLRSSRTDDWLNRRIRCRHLTTSAVAGVPWWEEP